MYNLDLEKAEEPEIKLPTFLENARECQKKKTTSASLTTLKSLCGSQKTLENS